MKEALNRALDIALEKEYELRKTGQSHMIEPLITAIKEVLAQPAVAEQHKQSTTHGEPVAVVDLRNVNYVRWLDGAVFFEGTKLYTTPPQRPSRSDIKPLTDEQIKEITLQIGWTQLSADDLKFCRAIEAAHGIKE